MPEILIHIVLAVLSVTGLVYLYRLLHRWLLRSQTVCRQYTILQFDKYQNDVEYILRGHISKIKAEHSEQYSRLLCIAETMNDEMKQICRALAQEYPFVMLCSFGQLHDYIAQ